MQDTYTAALKYIYKDWAVFPCKGKFPITEHGFKDASKDPNQIANWWDNGDVNHNIGIACGAISNITVLDVDPKHGGIESLQILEAEFGKFKTLQAITGSGGSHFYFRYVPGIKNKVGFMDGLDIRTEGGYVIAPPSTHPETEAEYTWVDPDHVITEMPDFLKQYLLNLDAKPEVRVAEGAAVMKGGRNDYLTRAAGSMQRRGMSEEAITAALMAENETQCDPPLPKAEVERIVASVARYAPTHPIANEVTDTQSPIRNNTLTDGDSGGGLIKASDLVSNTLAYLQDKAKVKGTPTGLDGLDALLGGGRRLGEVTCWHAEAKTGKNTLWHYLMYLWLELGVPMAYASRELSPDEEVIPNLLSVAIGSNAWLSDVTDEKKALYDSVLKKWPLYFSEGYGYFPVEQIREFVERGIEAGIQYFWFDHLHYMLQDPEDHKAASHLIKDLKAFAKTKKIHIDIIIQPNKLQDGQRLSLNSIKGGASMGQAIDNLLILERVKQPGVKNVSKLTLEVARSKLCKPGSIYLQFDSDSTRFVETEPDQSEGRSTESLSGGDIQPHDTQLISDSIPVADRSRPNRLEQPFRKIL